MINDLKNICDELDGYSSDRLGFAVLDAKCDTECNVWTLDLQTYCKDSEDTEPFGDDLLVTIIDRLNNKYSDTKQSYKVIRAIDQGSGEWDIAVERIKK